MRRADGHWPYRLRRPAGAHQRPRAILADSSLYWISTFSVCPSCSSTTLPPASLCSWRQQNALLFLCSLFFVEHRRGHPVRGQFQDGRSRCGVGYLPVPGCRCVLAMVVVFRRISALKSTDGHVVLFSWNMLGKVAVVAVPASCSELCLRWATSSCRAWHQHLWCQRHCRLFCSRQAEQHGHHFLYHAGQRHLQLHLPEHGCRQDGPRRGGLWRRPQSGVAAVRTAGGAVLLLWPLFAAAVHERPAGPCH